MAAMQLYSNALVYIYSKSFNGLLTQESSVSVTKNSGLNLVYTTFEGLGGASPGAKTVEISISNAVPSTDFEMNPDPSIFENEVVEVHIVTCDGSKASKHKCFIMSTEFGHSVNDAAKYDFKLTGRYGQFE